MRTQKIGRQDLRNCKRFHLKNAKDRVMGAIPFSGDDDDTDQYKLAELHCELGMVEGQLCSIPYELFDLPDLREILSLDTWNSCLTEEERFYLSAYLPDMDQQTFCSTLKEIFDGSDLHFGNPSNVFFQRLRGGFYPPKVAQLRECLQVLQRIKHHHFLRSYHDRMVEMFVHMRHLWEQSELSSSVEERICLWSKRRNHRTINLIDLNKFPKDDYPPDEEVSLGATGMELAESKSRKGDMPYVSADRIKSFAANCRGKGILKIKASSVGLLTNSNVKAVDSGMSEQFHSKPKGVLKIMPKVPSALLVQSENVPRGAQPTSPFSTQGVPDFKFSSLPAYLRFPDAVSLDESPLLRQDGDGSGAHTTLNQQPQCLLNQQEITMRSSYQSESSAASASKLEGQITLRSDNIAIFGQQKSIVGINLNEDDRPQIELRAAMSYPFCGERLWPNLQKGTEDFSQISLGLYPFDTKYHGKDRHVALMKDRHAIVYPRISEAVQRISGLDICKQETSMMTSSNPAKGESDIFSGKSDKLLGKSSVSGRFKDENVLPLTYKRRKVVAKANSIGTGKTITSGSDMNSNQIGLGSKAKNMKFKVGKITVNKEQ